MPRSHGGVGLRALSASVDRFTRASQLEDSASRVSIDVSLSHHWDISDVGALDKIVARLGPHGRGVEVIGYDRAKADLVDRFALHDKARVRWGHRRPDPSVIRVMFIAPQFRPSVHLDPDRSDGPQFLIRDDASFDDRPFDKLRTGMPVSLPGREKSSVTPFSYAHRSSAFDELRTVSTRMGMTSKRETALGRSHHCERS
jgi:hypothetical protein